METPFGIDSGQDNMHVWHGVCANRTQDLDTVLSPKHKKLHAVFFGGSIRLPNYKPDGVGIDGLGSSVRRK